MQFKESTHVMSLPSPLDVEKKRLFSRLTNLNHGMEQKSRIQGVDHFPAFAWRRTRGTSNSGWLRRACHRCCFKAPERWRSPSKRVSRGTQPPRRREAARRGSTRDAAMASPPSLSRAETLNPPFETFHVLKRLHLNIVC